MNEWLARIDVRAGVIVAALAPDANGKLLWKKQIGKGGKIGGVQWGSATDGTTVYVALSDAQLRVAPPGTPGAQAALGRMTPGRVASSGIPIPITNSRPSTASPHMAVL